MSIFRVHTSELHLVKCTRLVTASSEIAARRTALEAPEETVLETSKSVESVEVKAASFAVEVLDEPLETFIKWLEWSQGIRVTEEALQKFRAWPGSRY